MLARLDCKPHVSALEEVLNTLSISEEGKDSATENKFNIIVAVKQGNILATAFHPELTNDLRWHK